jgi:hypothetical protein
MARDPVAFARSLKGKPVSEVNEACACELAGRSTQAHELKYRALLVTALRVERVWPESAR